MHPLQPKYEFEQPDGARPGRGEGRTAAQLQYALALIKSGQSVVFLVGESSMARYALNLAISIALRDYPAPSVTDEATNDDQRTTAAENSIKADGGQRNLRFTDEPHHRLFFMSITERVMMRGSNAVLIADHGINWPKKGCEEWKATLCDHRYDPAGRVPDLLPPTFPGS